MFRIKAHYIDGCILLRSGRFSKKTKATSTGGQHAFSKLDPVVKYQFIIQCRDLSRDSLHSMHGKDWRKYEQPLQIMKSSISAWKRIRAVNHIGK